MFIIFILVYWYIGILVYWYISILILKCDLYRFGASMLLK
ncbi:hypothetical protein HMPREF9945_01620 [Clostridioides difficile 70-100-2010]|nr:hypothetical protein HMPREF9945_01620 [Clostridioides difficile 70-100-2010]